MTNPTTVVSTRWMPSVDTHIMLERADLPDLSIGVSGKGRLVLFPICQSLEGRDQLVFFIGDPHRIGRDFWIDGILRGIGVERSNAHGLEKIDTHVERHSHGTVGI